jgi:hypothetical protein
MRLHLQEPDDCHDRLNLVLLKKQQTGISDVPMTRCPDVSICPVNNAIT